MLFINFRVVAVMPLTMVRPIGINRNGREIVSSSPSSIRDYVKQTGHTASIDDFRVISKSSNSYDLLIHESLLIQRDRPSLISQESSISMVLF